MFLTYLCLKIIQHSDFVQVNMLPDFEGVGVEHQGKGLALASLVICEK